MMFAKEGKVTFVSSILAMALVVIFFAQMGYWWWWPYNIMTINKLNIVGSVSHERGLIFQMDYCKTDSAADLEANVQYSFINKTSYNVPGKVQGPLPVGCHVIQEEIEIPILPSGDYHLEMRREYRVNPVRIVVVNGKTEQFTINTSLPLSDSMIELVGVNRTLVKQNQKLLAENAALHELISKLLTKLK